MLISVHLPKTAGTSFLSTLDILFGKNLFQDYFDMSKIQECFLNLISPSELIKKESSKIMNAEYECVHGHFFPAKYSFLFENPNVKFITWLRNPVDRLFSHYAFFKRSYDPNTAGPIFRKIIEEEWSLEDFCFSKEYQNLYTKYLWNFPYEKFDFVGITEFYNEDLKYFSKKFSQRKIISNKLNCAIEKFSHPYAMDIEFRREIEVFHSEDVILYHRALRDREQRA